MTNQLINQTSQTFRTAFQSDPQYIFLSPGRINIIGEHIDYNNGYVLPAAIDRYICFAVSRRNDNQCILLAHDLRDRYSFDLTSPITPVSKMWANYIMGVIAQLELSGHRQFIGLNICFSSNIPIGSGLSSSAALECGVAFAFNHIFQLGLSKKQLALIGQRSEHSFVGVNCGIMDQFASVFGKAGHVMKLDCDSLEYEYHSADFSDYSVILFDSNVKHSHLTSGYNDRRRDTETGIKMIKKSFPEVKTFRDCSLQQLQSLRQELGEVIYRRCRFVILEIQRVLDAVEALKISDIPVLGRLMLETHIGLSADYEVSCSELDFLVERAVEQDAVVGARMMGGGFGGCSINLVRKGSEDELIAFMAESYHKAFGISLKTYQLNISDGTCTYLDSNPSAGEPSAYNTKRHDRI